jgi:hypothetical protein
MGAHPGLHAAHVKPHAKPGPHQVGNALSLRPPSPGCDCV